MIDIGTSSVRASLVHPDGSVTDEHRITVLPDTPMPGLVEFDPRAMADAALEAARRVLATSGPVEGVGVAAQRASSVIWDRATGEALAPGPAKITLSRIHI